MTRLGEDGPRFEAALVARAETEDYRPIEEAAALPNGMSTTVEELESLARELFDIT